jgi:hypothetical protein
MLLNVCSWFIATFSCLHTLVFEGELGASSSSLMQFLLFFDAISTHNPIGNFPIFLTDISFMDDSQHVSADPFFPHYNVSPF